MLVKNKEGSYIIKEIYRNFDLQVLAQATKLFLADIANNLVDKHSVCIFKEIVLLASREPQRLDQLLATFAGHFPQHKTNTFYHFGLQYFLEVN